MISFTVKVKFSNGGVHKADFLANGWADAMPQAAEIIEDVAEGAAPAAGVVDRVKVSRNY